MAQSQDERSLRRLIKRSLARRDFTMLVMLFHELGIVFLEESGEQEATRTSGDIAWDHMKAENGVLQAAT